ncbi:MAG: hypothetical protein QW324_04420 [Thermofilaceae archaeon]
MVVAEVTVLVATALAALLTKKSSVLPYALALQSLALTATEVQKLLQLEPHLAFAYLGAAVVHVAAPPILLMRLERIFGERAEKAPLPLVAASIALAATTVALTLLESPRLLPYALASLLPILMITYSRDPVRVAVSLNMASNALHPLIVVEGNILYAAVSNISITMVIYVAYLLAREGWETYRSPSLDGWDRWLKR